MGSRKNGAERYENGRLKVSQAYDRGNKRISAMRQLFDAKCFQNGGRGKESYDGIGQLWLLGKLEGYPVESNRLLEVGREYARLYHQRYSEMAAGIAKYETADRTTNSVARRTRDDVKFDRMDSALDVHSQERRAIYDLVCRYHNTDSICDWAARIIGDGLLSRGFVFDLMELSNQGDHQMMEAAVRGLFALHDGEMPGRLERVAA
jgi:hypothetical protein